MNAQDSAASGSCALWRALVAGGAKRVESPGPCSLGSTLPEQKPPVNHLGFIPGLQPGTGRMFGAVLAVAAHWRAVGGPVLLRLSAPPGAAGAPDTTFPRDSWKDL